MCVRERQRGSPLPALHPSAASTLRLLPEHPTTPPTVRCYHTRNPPHTSPHPTPPPPRRCPPRHPRPHRHIRRVPPTPCPPCPPSPFKRPSKPSSVTLTLSPTLTLTSTFTPTQAAEQAVIGISRHYSDLLEEPPAIAAAHYTLAGFYTYHHRRRPELGNALVKAQQHLQQALSIQNRQLGPLHVSTLCSQLVKAQVMLMQNNAAGCGRLLHRQLQYCERSLGPKHPLAAKMLAVMARLQLKLGHEDECESLQQRVLLMRQAALGTHHEDTHRSAMDVYSRRRQVRSVGEGPLARRAWVKGAVEVREWRVEGECGLGGSGSSGDARVQPLRRQ